MKHKICEVSACSDKMVKSLSKMCHRIITVIEMLVSVCAFEQVLTSQTLQM